MKQQTPTRYWMIVASHDHVKTGIQQGFTQACHGKATPLKRMHPGDYIIFYSGKEYFGQPKVCQKFTALGKIKDDKIYQVEMSPGFCPYRRNVEFFNTTDVSILPLIEKFEFIQNKKSWGYPFRWGFFEIHESDFNLLSSLLLNN